MKKCVTCGAISTDDEQTCGVCRASLEGIVSLSMEQAGQIAAPEFHLNNKVSRTAMIETIAGTVLLGIGALVLYIAGPLDPFGFIPLLLGMFALIVGVNSLSTALTRPWRGHSRAGPVLATSYRTQADKRDRMDVLQEKRRKPGDKD
jgi:hypothetical protein